MAKRQYMWSVRGVSREARQRAKKSARDRRVTIGEWVSLALTAVANDELAAEPENLAPAGPTQDVASQAGLGARERALLALANRAAPPRDKSEQEQQAPWSIRGVSQVARVKAAQAAARRRMTIGAWVDHAIVTYADRQAGIEAPPPVLRAAEPGAPSEAPRAPEKTMKLVEAVARRIDEMRTPGTPAEAVADHADDLERADQKISELAERVRENERRNEQQLAALTSALTIFANRLKLAGEPKPRADEPVAERPRAPAAEPAKAKDRLSEAELVFWEAIKDSDNPEDYEAYLETFPEGVFTSLARKRAMRVGAPQPGGPEQQPEPGAPPGPQPERPRKPPVASYPRLDFDTLNERAIENTKRLGQGKD